MSRSSKDLMVHRKQSKDTEEHRPSRGSRTVDTEDVTGSRIPGVSRRHYSMGWQLLRAARQASLGFMSLSHKATAKPHYENSYRLEPKTVFNVCTVENIIESVLHKNLAYSVYNPMSMRIECKSLSSAILKQVKALRWERYRFVCVVNIMDGRSAACLGSRMLCNQETDNYASFTYTTGRLSAVGTVYGIYLD